VFVNVRKAAKMKQIGISVPPYLQVSSMEICLQFSTHVSCFLCTEYGATSSAMAKCCRLTCLFQKYDLRLIVLQFSYLTMNFDSEKRFQILTSEISTV
jgi:hypothetical protein